MALKDTLETLANSIKVSDKCAFRALYERLPEADQKALDNAINKGIPVTIMVNALRQEGYATSSDSFRAHLKERCRCPKA